MEEKYERVPRACSHPRHPVQKRARMHRRVSRASADDLYRSTKHSEKPAARIVVIVGERDIDGHIGNVSVHLDPRPRLGRELAHAGSAMERSTLSGSRRAVSRSDLGCLGAIPAAEREPPAATFGSESPWCSDLRS